MAAFLVALRLESKAYAQWRGGQWPSTLESAGIGQRGCDPRDFGRPRERDANAGTHNPWR
jgi:hypothetical protein